MAFPAALCPFLSRPALHPLTLRAQPAHTPYRPPSYQSLPSTPSPVCPALPCACPSPSCEPLPVISVSACPSLGLSRGLALSLLPVFVLPSPPDPQLDVVATLQ